MKHLTSALIIAATGLLTACPEEHIAKQDIKPLETDWEKVVDGLPFPLSGDGQVKSLQIGRREYSENFANRGHIEVLYDHPEETISIEMKKYLYANELDAYGDQAAGTPGVFSRMYLWAYASSGNPTKPSSQDAAEDCTKDTWKDGCKIHVYYDGLSQPQRSGADFRVHLPTGWRGDLTLITEDNADDTTFPRRGNLKVDGFCSSGEFDLEAGRADVKFCDSLTPAPECNADGIADCEGFPDGSGSEAWAKECACGDGTLFGSLRIEAPQPWAANITVDIPPNVWLNATLSNTEMMKPHSCKPTIDCPAQSCVPDATTDEYAPHAEFNYPSSAAPAGAGYNLTVISGGCTEIPYVDTPDQWTKNTEDLPQELRGNLKVCSGCL